MPLLSSQLLLAARAVGFLRRLLGLIALAVALLLFQQEDQHQEVEERTQIVESMLQPVDDATHSLDPFASETFVLTSCHSSVSDVTGQSRLVRADTVGSRSRACCTGIHRYFRRDGAEGISVETGERVTFPVRNAAILALPERSAFLTAGYSRRRIPPAASRSDHACVFAVPCASRRAAPRKGESNPGSQRSPSAS